MPEHTPVQLLQASEDVLYEAEMMARMARLSCSQVQLDDAADAEAVKYATLESFAVHFRAVCDFLYLAPNPRNPDDVLAEEYTANWQTTRPAYPPRLKASRERCNKEIQHITSGRLLRRHNKAWDPVSIAKELIAVFDQFLAGVDPSLLHKGCLDSYRAEALRLSVLAPAMLSSGHPTCANMPSAGLSTGSGITTILNPQRPKNYLP